MKCALVGSRFFAASVLQALRNEPGVEIVRVVAPAADDRLALAAQQAGLSLHVLATYLNRDPETRPDGFVVEGPRAGGHSAPPRGKMTLEGAGGFLLDLLHGFQVAGFRFIQADLAAGQPRVLDDDGVGQSPLAHPALDHQSNRTRFGKDRDQSDFRMVGHQFRQAVQSVEHGGAGSFDGIFVTGIVAVLLT